MTTTHQTATYGTAAHGGKVHRSSGGLAGCLSDRGHKPIRMIVAEVTGVGEFPTLEERAAALIAAGVSAEHVCSKCSGGVRKAMKEAAA